MAEGENKTAVIENNNGGTVVEGFQNQGGKTQIIKPEGSQTQAGGSGEGAGDGKSSTEGAGGAGDSGEGQNGDAPDAEGKYTHPESKEKISAHDLIGYYKGQFGASTKGAQDLLDKQKILTGELDTSKGTIEKLTKEIEDLKQIAEGKNPEGFQARELQERLKTTTEELALVKENQLLDQFEKTNPLAASKRETLRSLSRANPKADLQKLWDENLKTGAEAEEAKRIADEVARKKGAGDQGKGTSTREPAGNGNTVRGPRGDSGLTLEEFNKLPVKERGQILAKIGL